MIQWIALAVGLVAVAFFFFGDSFAQLFGGIRAQAPALGGGAETAVSFNDSQFRVDELSLGSGQEALRGSLVTIHYVGMLTNGQIFDSSRVRGQPFQFILDSGQVIPGFDRGVLGMKVGGKRRITIPPSLGYGNVVAGPIPANSTLVFEVELLDVRRPQ
ncbi:FKBP-type peptidyl-prolyl cis-trans isomerase [Patescibacteria group bacterium]|nr:MAG: FKBP-type peptidyl-prolyl cis-trans isomerase [Patescibacteria group bacterium]